MQYEQLVEWLFINSGPILRYRIAMDLMDASRQERIRLLRESKAIIEVQRWLNKLSKAQNVHGSKDTENAPDNRSADDAGGWVASIGE
jgi:hypothetical protein